MKDLNGLFSVQKTAKLTKFPCGDSGIENGNYRFRSCELNWIKDLIFQAKEKGVNVFVIQTDTWLSKKLKLSDRYGGVISEWPNDIKVREFPI